MARPITVLVATPREVVSAGLRCILDGHATVVGVAASGKQAAAQARKLSPDVVLVSDRLSDGDGIDGARKILAATKSRIVVLAADENPTHLARAAAVGVTDYVFEGSTPRAIVAAVRGAASGARPSATTPYGRLMRDLRSREPDSRVDLSPREQQVVRHLGYGLSNNEIAQSMEISVETVKEHVQNVLRKTVMGDRTHVAVWAVRSGFV